MALQAIRAGICTVFFALGLGCLSVGTLQADAKPAAPKAAAVNVSDLVNTVKTRWNSEKSGDVKKVDDAFTGLKDASGDASQLAKIIKGFAGFKEGVAAKAVGEAITKSGVSRAKLRAALEKGRPAALQAIADPKYTEADRNSLQPRVDEACKPLFEIWRDPVGYAAGNLKLDLATPVAKLNALAARLGEIHADLAKWQDGANAEEEMRRLGAATFNIKKEELAQNESALSANEAIKDKVVTDEAKANVRVLNDYRMMLGKNALRIDLLLTKAAASHAKYLETNKTIGHYFAGHPDGASEGDRCKKAGYGGFVAENTLQGAQTGEAAVWQWYGAAEHHRPMIGDWADVGVGQSGVYWVQEFGGGGKGR